MGRRGLAVVVAAGAVTLLACGPGGGQARPESGAALDVVATTPVVADFVRNVGGDRVHVVQILKPGIDPHDYEASAADIQAIADADLVVENGVGLEASWLDDTVAAADYDGEVLDASRGVAVRTGTGEESRDPHIWHDPANARVMVDDIAAGLAAKDPAGKAGYERNAAGYDAKLAALDAENKAAIGTIPAAQRKLVTNHDAFGYYCARYGIMFVGSIIPSFDTSAELSGNEIADLVAQIERTGVRAVFSESSLPPKTADTVAREAGVQVVEGEDSLYADGLGPDGSPGGTYLSAERHNTATIVKALGGRV
jgi:ABC-type Zn uptake system ZnuABC Zn-binding protein ZnuA